MTDTRPQYDPTAYEIALQEWIRLVVSAYDGGGHTVEVIYKNQYGTRPDKPYLALQVISVTPHGEAFKSVSNVVGGGGDYEATLDQHYTGTVQVEAYGTTARQLMSDLVASIIRDDVAELNVSNCIYIQRADNVVDITTILDTSFEQRTQCDFRFAFSERMEYEAQGIETIGFEFEGDTPSGDTVTSSSAAP